MNGNGLFMGRDPPRLLNFARVAHTYRLGKTDATDTRIGARGGGYREDGRIRHLDLITKKHHVDLACNMPMERFISLMRETKTINRKRMPELIRENNSIFEHIGSTYFPDIVINANNSPIEIVEAITDMYELQANKDFNCKGHNPEHFRNEAKIALVEQVYFSPSLFSKPIGNREHVNLAKRVRKAIDFHPILKEAVFAAWKWVFAQRAIGRGQAKFCFNIPEVVNFLKIETEDLINKPQETEFLVLRTVYDEGLDEEGPFVLVHPERSDLILKLA